MRLEDIVDDINSKSEDYVNFITKKYNEYKYISEVPPIYLNYSVVYERLPFRLKTLFDNIYEIVSERFNYMFLFRDYDTTGYLANCLIDEYFKYCIQNDKNIENILYIDTKLFVQDFSKIVTGNTTGVKPALSYRLDTIYQNIETAPLVIWDYFNKVETDYEKKKLYNIMLSRYRRGLGNIFIIDKNVKTMEIYKSDMEKVMDVSAVIDCTNESFIFKMDDIDKGVN